MASNLRKYNDYTVGWVCALPKEQTAATAMLDERHDNLPKPPNDSNAYTLGSIGRHNIVIACLPKGKVGTSSAAAVAGRMVSTFPAIRFGLMVGIGGGVPPKVRLGDVVVSVPTGQLPGVVQWDMGKAEDGGNFQRTGALNNPPSLLLTALTQLESKHEFEGSKISEYVESIATKYPRLAAKYLPSDQLQDNLFRAGYSHINKGQSNWGDWEKEDEYEGGDDDCRYCDHSQTVRRKQCEMTVHFGSIASGNQVVKDAALRDRLSKDLGGILCIEMEAAGLPDSFPCVVVRGICDYADSHKNKAWQEHAAAVAAAFAKEILGYVQPNEVAHEQTAQEQLGEKLDCITDDIQQVQRLLLSEQDDMILQWMTPLEYGPQHSDYLEKRHEGTGLWFLDSREYQDWLETAQGTLFCPGIPGSGKTIITSMVINDIENKVKSDGTIGLAYIYFDYRKKDDQTFKNLILCIARQLGRTFHSLPPRLKELYKWHNMYHTQLSLRDALEILDWLAEMYQRVYIVIDALDECQVSDGCRTNLLSELFHLQRRRSVNLFATSRFIPSITERFKQAFTLEIRASKSDVQRYLQSHVGNLPSTTFNGRGLQKKITATVSEAVDGMFLLANIYLDSLDDKLTKKSVLHALKAMKKLHRQCRTSGEYEKDRMLTLAYERAIDRIRSQKPGFSDLAMRALSWITCAKRPLRTLEFQHALGVEVGARGMDQNNLTEIKYLVSICCGLVTVDAKSGIVRLVHYTTQEYLEKCQSVWFPDVHLKISEICTTYLTFRVFESGPTESVNDLISRFRQNPFYIYAATYWVYHASQTLSLDHVTFFLQKQKAVEASIQALRHFNQLALLPKSNKKHRQRLSGLHLAACFGFISATRALLSVHHVDVKDSIDGEDGQTPLWWATANGHEEIVHILLDGGADIEARDNDGRTSLWMAVVSRHLSVAELLIKRGADIEARDGGGRTPLWAAAAAGYKEVSELLIENGANIEVTDDFTWTPLHQAASHGSAKVAKLLIEKGADIEARDKEGQTPLSLAVIGGYSNAVLPLLVIIAIWLRIGPSIRIRGQIPQVE
ncbi:hypothetical protein PG999_001690 [Apiospora kogelbergensis]|uniref:Nucleoside phosphorylase domain-containing protein n=1 Tax=Apiospora kogelbergensis TaxID=1337665 RepID=A0AAW0R664_9PEZI